MPEWRVTVYTSQDRYKDFEVDADDENAAKEKALSEADTDDGEGWEYGDWSGSYEAADPQRLEDTTIKQVELADWASDLIHDRMTNAMWPAQEARNLGGTIVSEVLKRFGLTLPQREEP